MVERSERTSYAPGTPSWVDLGSPDAKAAADFYGGLFGWKAEMDPRPEAGGYGMFQIDGKNVAGLGPQMNTDMPPYWNVYVTVADAEEDVQLNDELAELDGPALLRLQRSMARTAL